MLVFSPLNHFKIGVQSVGFSNALGLGLNGEVEAIPEGYVYESVLTSGSSIHNALEKWGGILLKQGGKDPERDVEDVTTAVLSYWTGR